MNAEMNSKSYIYSMLSGEMNREKRPPALSVDWPKEKPPNPLWPEDRRALERVAGDLKSWCHPGAIFEQKPIEMHLNESKRT